MDEDWLAIATAPKDEPIRVWASLDPGDPLMTWREFTAVQKWYNWWHTYDARRLRLYPTHWKHLPSPQQQEMK